jgi:hypothetical protein
MIRFEQLHRQMMREGTKTDRPRRFRRAETMAANVTANAACPVQRDGYRRGMTDIAAPMDRRPMRCQSVVPPRWERLNLARAR